MDIKELQAQIEALKAENDALKASKTRKERTLSWKVSDKGAISIYGFGRFPVTLYYTQLMKLNEVMSQVVAFAEENKASLAIKPTLKVVA